MRGIIYATAFVLSSGYFFRHYRKREILALLAGILALISGVLTVFQTFEFFFAGGAGASAEFKKYLTAMIYTSFIGGPLIAAVAEYFGKDWSPVLQRIGIAMFVGAFIGFYFALLTGNLGP